MQVKAVNYFLIALKAINSRWSIKMTAHKNSVQQILNI